MTADRFFPIHFSIDISLFNATFNNTLLISKTIGAHFPFNGWSNPAKFFIVLIATLSFYFLDTFSE